MKLSKEDFAELMEILSEVESFKPVVRSVLDTLKLYSDEIQEIPKAISEWLVDASTASVNQFIGNGFSREEAILLTIDNKLALQNMLRNFKTNLDKN